MNTGENTKILDNDLLQQVDLDEWEVINENKIITKNKENCRNDCQQRKS